MSTSRGAWRFAKETQGRPIADDIYKTVFGKGIDIELHQGTDFDKLFGIDVAIRFKATGQVLYVQEKFLSHHYAKFDTVTIEYMNDPKTGKKGDWFHLGAHVYMAAYFSQDSTSFCKWALIDWRALVSHGANNPNFWQQNRNKNDGAKANFKHVKYEHLPRTCVIAASYDLPSSAQEEVLRLQGELALYQLRAKNAIKVLKSGLHVFDTQEDKAA